MDKRRITRNKLDINTLTFYGSLILVMISGIFQQFHFGGSILSPFSSNATTVKSSIRQISGEPASLIISPTLQTYITTAIS